MRPVVLLVGGIGKLESVYRQAAESLGYDLDYCERPPLPSPHRHIAGRARPPAPVNRIAAILVVASVVSHGLEGAAARLAAACRCPILYLRRPSISAVRRALGELASTLTAERYRDE